MHLYAAYLGGDLGPGRVGEDHEVVFVVADDELSARRAAKTKWGGQGRAHIDALTRVDMIDGYAIAVTPGARATPPTPSGTTSRPLRRPVRAPRQG